MKIIIPFRLKSDRFPNKVISKFFGKPLILYTLEIAKQLNEEIILTATTDDYEQIKNIIETHNYYTFIPTSENCSCATDRIIEISKQFDNEQYISLPIDEPLINPKEIIKCFNKFKTGAATLYCDFFNLNDCTSKLSAKIVLNANDEVVYMSREVIPCAKNGEIDLTMCKKNIGVFFFSQDFLNALNLFSDHYTNLDKYEGLEQLRWTELGLQYKAFKARHDGFGIDIPEQINLLEERYNGYSRH